jgi:tetratricopeptide (TPR) repeat protein
MPQVQAKPELHFTNHWIGIYGRGNLLTPMSRTGRSIPPLVLKGTPEGKLAPPNDPASLRPLYEQAVKDREKQLGSAHPKLARSWENLGLFSRETGDPKAAEVALRKALDIDRANRDVRLPSVLEELAQILVVNGKVREAFDLFQQAAGSADPRVVSLSYASLAVLDPARADLYYSNGLKAEEEASGKDHPRVAVVLNNLALAVKAKNDLKAAEALFRRALAIQRMSLGEGHYETATTLSNLGSLLQNLGRLAEAERLEREALHIFEQKLPQSTELATVCTNLADLVASKGDRTTASILLRQAISIDEAIYGLDHPEVAGDLTNLGLLLRESGQDAAADSLLKRALRIYDTKLGPDSPQSRDIRENLRRRP